MKTYSFLALWLIGYSLSGHAESIRVVTETTAFSYIKEGKVAGPATEVIELSLKKAGITDYSINIYPWARSYDLALKKANVLIYLIARTPSRETDFKWVGELSKPQCFLIKLKERTDIKVNKLADAKQYSIGVVRDDVRQQYLHQQGLTRLSVSAQQSDSLRQLVNHQIDLIALFEADMPHLCQQQSFDCSKLDKLFLLNELSNGIYMAFSKKTPDILVKKTQYAFEKLKAEGLVKKTMERPPLPH
jgi:polar amino acid transport system substrate-binding protein